MTRFDEMLEGHKKAVAEYEQMKSELNNPEYESLVEQAMQVVEKNNLVWNSSNREFISADDMMIYSFFATYILSGRSTGLQFEESHSKLIVGVYNVLKENGINISPEIVEYFYKTRGFDLNNIHNKKGIDEVIELFKAAYGAPIKEREAELVERRKELETVAEYVNCIRLAKKIDGMSREELEKYYAEFFGPVANEKKVDPSFGARLAEIDAELAKYVSPFDKMLPAYKALVEERKKVEEGLENERKRVSEGNEEARESFKNELSSKSDEELKHVLLRLVSSKAENIYGNLLKLVEKKNNPEMAGVSKEELEEAFAKREIAIKDIKASEDAISALDELEEAYRETKKIEEEKSKAKKDFEEKRKEEGTYITNSDVELKKQEVERVKILSLDTYPGFTRGKREQARSEAIGRAEEEYEEAKAKYDAQQAEENKITASYDKREEEANKRFIEAHRHAAFDLIVIYPLIKHNSSRWWFENGITEKTFIDSINNQRNSLEKRINASEARLSSEPLGITPESTRVDIERVRQEHKTITSAEDVPSYVDEALFTVGEDGKHSLADFSPMTDEEFVPIVESARSRAR